MFDNVKEECGVFGVYSKKPERLAYITCVGLSGLQQMELFHTTKNQD